MDNAVPRQALQTGLVIALLAASGRASQIAFDSAADSAYNGGWTQGSNGGFGWGGGWSFTPFDLPQFRVIGDSTTNGRGDPEGDGDINTPRVAGGRAWGIHGLSTTASRNFSGPLSPGQTFSIDFDDSKVAGVPNLQVSLGLGSTGGAGGINFTVGVKPDYFVLGPDNTSIDTGIVDTDQGLRLVFTQILASTVNVSVTPYIAGASTFSVDLANVGELNAVGFTVQDSDTSYINNMSLTPEPCAVTLGLVGALPLLLRRRRRVGGESRAGK